MNKGQLDQQTRENRERDSQSRKDEQSRKGRDRQEPQRNPAPQRDQLDDEGRQKHMGHGDRQASERAEQPLEEGDQPNEGLGRPVRVGKEKPRDEKGDGKDEGGRWDDKTEGTSRQS